ncbi:MAG: 30S ribosomal protein S9 [bacterium]|jgi:small subunit ribosomal protein S9
MKVPSTSYYATGRRKNAIARVWLIPAGSGQITINKRDASEYLGRVSLEAIVNQPLQLVRMYGKVDILATAEGGGIAGQAGAVRHGIARALVVLDPNLRQTLRRETYLTRDPRVKERKKYGRKRARRGFQFVKR